MHRRPMTDDERQATSARVQEIQDGLVRLDLQRADLVFECRRLAERLMYGVPERDTVRWVHLFEHLQRTGGTARVLFKPPIEDMPEMEWQASVMGLNRYDADGVNTATWHPDRRDMVILLDQVHA